jgi:DNA-binding transcriptional ArsR family regulator
MGQSAVSHQLRFLRNMRIVKRRKVGKTVYYSLDDAHVEQIFELTLQHLKHE